jgi:hypothetical protein
LLTSYFTKQEMFYCEKCDTIYDIIQGDKKSEKTGGSDVNKKSKLEIDDALANEEKGGDISSSSEGEDTSDTDTKKESKHHRKAQFGYRFLFRG